MLNLVLAAGRASSELGVLVPPRSNKVILRILGKPIAYYPITGLYTANKSVVHVVYREGEDEVPRELSSSVEYPLEYIEQKAGWSVRDAILSARERIDAVDYFLLSFGDLIVDAEAYLKLVSAHVEEAPDATVLVTPVEPHNIGTYGIASVDENWFVRKVYTRGGVVGEAVYTVAGVYILPSRILDYLEKGLDLPEALDALARSGRVKAVLWTGTWVDIGYPADMLEAVYQLLSKVRDVRVSGKAVVEDTARIEGPVIVEDGAYIDHYAVVKGPVYIGRGGFVGAHSFIREYTDLEEKTRVGSYGEVKFSIVQPYCLMDSRVTVLNSVLGGNSIVGTGVTTLNVLPAEEAPPRLREHVVRRGVFEKKIGAVIGYGARVPPYTILNPGSVYR
ncbi:sugar phosphate nucleotidyltransferase [Thermogladius sp. 4427co]|uniref:sugar phosphate nucleotidyltransferase n=1 Tax=Thermogladius sp. 4427co TaxID=3450718 RepID=UPI003F79E6DE